MEIKKPIGNSFSYPSKVTGSTEKGKCLVAATDLPKGTIVGKFEGEEVRYVQVPDDAICYAIHIGEHASDDRWVLPGSDAFFANHSCDPNCIVDDDLTLVTIRSVRAEEEITYSYDMFEDEEESDFHWDPRWNFECKCGSVMCRKKIQRYVQKVE